MKIFIISCPEVSECNGSLHCKIVKTACASSCYIVSLPFCVLERDCLLYLREKSIITKNINLEVSANELEQCNTQSASRLKVIKFLFRLDMTKRSFYDAISFKSSFLNVYIFDYLYTYFFSSREIGAVLPYTIK